MKLCRIIPAVLILVLGTPVLAQAPQGAANQDVILILDASGSMWGQIDGVNKIVIAKDTVETLVRSLEPEQRLGLVAYGHRREGDCNDIQTLADVGADREAVITQIRGISPKGKTPLSKSVEHAANALNYTTNAATVILVSDGLENCDADPCALARTLEENGLDFTVHVVGFDVTEQERQGLICVAEETGGQFLAAGNADELTNALAQVALLENTIEPEAPESVSVPQTVALKATLLQNGPDIQSALSWSVKSIDSDEVVFEQSDAGYVDFEVVPGDYIAGVSWSGWKHGGEKSGSRTFTVVAARPSVVTVPIDLEIPVSLNADTEILVGTPVNVRWSGPDDLGAALSVNRLDDGPRRQIYFTPAGKARDTFQASAVKEAGGNEAAAVQNLDTDGDGDFDHDDLAQAQIGGPSIAGDYEVRYILADPRLVLARQPLRVVDGNYSVSAPDEVAASSQFEVQWNGPLTAGDFVTIIERDSEKAFRNGRTAKLTEGQPATLTAPPEPGEFEVRYVLANGYTTYPGMQHAVQASQVVTVTDVSAGVAGPVSVVGGSMIDIDVTPVAGADWQNDYVSIIPAGADKGNRDSRISLSRSEHSGQEITLQVPNIEGDYEIAYFLVPGDRILARQPIAITRAEASVQAPATVKAGQDFQVSYSGPLYPGDRVVMVSADKPDSSMFNATPAYGFLVTEGGNSGTINGVKAAARPGEYEVRYTTGLQHQVLARAAVTVIE